ncbi:DUF4389 domain-containing protein [Pseudomonas sp. Marseille-QA0892]
MNAGEKLAREGLILRIIWMLLFFLVWQAAELLLLGVALAQLVIRIIRGAPNLALMSFGGSLASYLAQIGRFGTFQTDDKPWPFADWPQTTKGSAPAAAASAAPQDVPKVTP